MIRFAAVAAILVWLIPSAGGLVGDVIEVGYTIRDSNTRLAVSVASATGAEIVPMYGEER